MNLLKTSDNCFKKIILNKYLFAINEQKRQLSANCVTLSYHTIPGLKSDTTLPPILIFHGLFGSKNNWKSISKSLSAKTGRSVFAFDLRNHGSSPHTPGVDSTLRAMANDIKLFLDSNKYQKSTLIGHSLGGRVVMQFAFDLPERVEKLIAVDITPLSSIPSAFFMNSSFIDRLSKSIENISKDLNLSEVRKQVNENLKPIISDQFIRGFFLMSLDKSEKTGLFWRFNLNAIKFMIENKYINKIEISKPFLGQSLLIHGQNSEYVKRDDYKSIREVMPNIEIVSIPESGHYLHIEKPNELIANVVSFLNSN